MMQTKKSIPARLPKKETVNDIKTSFIVTRRDSNAVVMYFYDGKLDTDAESCANESPYHDIRRP